MIKYHHIAYPYTTYFIGKCSCVGKPLKRTEAWRCRSTLTCMLFTFVRFCTNLKWECTLTSFISKPQDVLKFISFSVFCKHVSYNVPCLSVCSKFQAYYFRTASRYIWSEIESAGTVGLVSSIMVVIDKDWDLNGVMVCVLMLTIVT